MYSERCVRLVFFSQGEFLGVRAGACMHACMHAADGGGKTTSEGGEFEIVVSGGKSVAGQRGRVDGISSPRLGKQRVRALSVSCI